MTQLSRERIEQYISDPLEYGLTRSEQMEMARRLLAAEAQEPVRYINKFTGVCVTLEQQPDAATDTAVYVPLYAAPQPVAAPELTVWYGPMPESNGKTNWTAILHRKGEGRCFDGFTIDRSEYPGRVRYAADKVRYLIGELAERPCILDYDADEHSGYVSSKAKPVSVPVVDLPSEFYSSEGVVVQLEKVMAALAVCGVKYKRKGNACRAAVLNQTHVKQPSGGALQLVGEVVARNHPNHERNVDFRWLDFNVEPGTKLYAIKQERG